MPDQEPTPAPPPSGPGPELGPKSTSTGLPSNVAAALACIPLIGGIIFYIVEKHDTFVRFYAMQSIIFGGAWLLFNIVSRILFLILWSIPAIGGILVFFWGIIQAARSHSISGCVDCRHRESVHRRALGHSVHRAGGAEARRHCLNQSFRAKSRLQRSGRSPRGQAFNPVAKLQGDPAGSFDSAQDDRLPAISRLLPSESVRDLAAWSRV